MTNQININKNLRWLSFVNPREKDIKNLRNESTIHPIILDELLRPSDRSRIENHGDYIFLVYHLPIYNVENRASRRVEIDIIASKTTVITSTYETLEPVVQFERDLGKKFRGDDIKTTAQIIYYLLEEINEFSMRQLKHIERKVQFVGDDLFRHTNQKLLEEMSYIKRDLLDFSMIAVAQKTTLESLIDSGSNIWNKEAKIYFTDLFGDFLKVHYLLENLRATIESYSDTISQIFQFKTSEVIRTFSVLVVLVLCLFRPTLYALVLAPNLIP